MRILPTRRAGRGITLVELIVFILIVSVALAGVLSVFNAAVRGSSTPQARKQVLAIAEALLQEVVQKSYQNDAAGDNAATPAAGCTKTTTPSCRTMPEFSAALAAADRPNYNDVDDYNGFAQTGVTQPDGTTAIPGLSGYAYSVTVSAATLGTPAATAKKIVVQVTGAGETVSLTGYRTDHD